MSGPIEGKKRIRTHYESYFAAFPEIAVELGEVFVSSDQFCAEMHLTGIFTGSPSAADGVAAPTVKKVAWSAVWLVQVSHEGLITDIRTYWDNLDFVRQLGFSLVPPSGTVSSESQENSVGQKEREETQIR